MYAPAATGTVRANASRSESSRLYLLVLAGIVAGALIGATAPGFAVQLKPLADAFIALIRMLIAPLIFLTLTLGIRGAADVGKLGRVGLKSILYFEAASTLALAIGLIAVNVVRPGAGFHIDPRTLDPGIAAAAAHATAADAPAGGAAGLLLQIIPAGIVDAFTTRGNVLQVLLLAVLAGTALIGLGETARPLVDVLEAASKLLFRVIHLVLRLAPIGAGAAIAFTVGKFGLGSFAPMLRLLATVYLTCALFVGGVLGLVARLCGFRILRFLYYIRQELLVVLGTSSSESVLAPLMEKLEALGCSRRVVGLVVPTGYSFNLDGTNIYLTVAALFVAQALGVHLTLGQQLQLLAVAMLTSKGAAGVTGAGFATLAATLAVVPAVPVTGLALIIGIDRFMSEVRALTNVIGNGVGAIAIAHWEGELEPGQLAQALRRPAAARAAAGSALIGPSNVLDSTSVLNTEE